MSDCWMVSIRSRASLELIPDSPYPTRPESVSTRIKQPSPTLSSCSVLIALILTMFANGDAIARYRASQARAGKASAVFRKLRRVQFIDSLPLRSHEDIKDVWPCYTPSSDAVPKEVQIDDRCL